MSNWNYLRINHSRKNHIDLYCRQLDDSLEIYLTNGNENDVKIFVHDILIGKLNDLYFDQNSNKINWVKKEYKFEGLSCELDMVKARERQGSVDHIDYLTVLISNAINFTFTNNLFAKYLQTNILGHWIYKDFAIEFDHNRQYKKNTSQTIINPLFLAVANVGKYSFSKNMMFLEDKSLMALRMQVVDLVDDKLVLPRIRNGLFFILTKR